MQVVDIVNVQPERASDCRGTLRAKHEVLVSGDAATIVSEVLEEELDCHGAMGRPVTVVEAALHVLPILDRVDGGRLGRGGGRLGRRGGSINGHRGVGVEVV